jgi:mannose/cellobiose epimerase-like protein (N-acyl-D-glucosamine 2-epimerase family)
MDSLHGARTPLYRDALEKAWLFTRDVLTDAARGGVYQSVDAEGRVNRGKSHDWMATYHSARALLLTSDRLRRQAAGSR